MKFHRILFLKDSGRLRDDVSTDEITPVAILSHYDEKLARFPYTGLQADGGLPIAAGSTVKFGPGGNHIMLTRLNRTLRAGDAVELTLDFERSPDQTIAVRILPATATDSHGMAM